MLFTFEVLESLLKVLHNPLAGLNGGELILAAGELNELERVQKDSSLLKTLWIRWVHVGFWTTFVWALYT